MKITIACVGKVKEKFYRDAISEFQKRLSSYCTLDFYEVTDEKTPDNASETEEIKIKTKEGERLLKGIPDQAYCIALDLKGKEIDSVRLANQLADLYTHGKSHIVFVIGGSLGLSDEILRRADFRLCFSPMTFPHQLMRVILLEQIYRTFRIQHNEPYHK